MGAIEGNLLTLAILGAIALSSVFWVVRWWREQQYALNDKTILITGGSRGLGLVIARMLGQAGARLAICVRNGVE